MSTLLLHFRIHNFHNFSSVFDIVGELGGVEYALRCTLILTSDIVLGAYVIDKNHRYVIGCGPVFRHFEF